jgi:hypothetical protein
MLFSCIIKDTIIVISDEKNFCISLGGSNTLNQLEMGKTIIENLSLFKSLFRGRDDIFAVRWEKDGKSGYFPAYDFDPYQFRLHKIKGGTINVENFVTRDA